MKILNLYAGVGGNRDLWGDDHDITAVELNEEIAKIYQDRFPNDEVIVTDAHEYLLENYNKYDFIWASPPCPTHSVTNNYLHYQDHKRYPDMKLYQEIIYLQKFHKGKYCIENVISYYDPLIKPQELDRHYFWANFYISPIIIPRKFNIANAKASTRKPSVEQDQLLKDFLGINLDKYVISNKRLLYRNCVHPKLGKHILDHITKNINEIETQENLMLI